MAYCGYGPPEPESDSNSNPIQLMIEEDKQKKKRLAALLLATIPLAHIDGRQSPFFRERLKWPDHVAMLNKEGPNAFYKMYRMHYHSYMKLCSLIHHDVQKNIEMANRKTGNYEQASTIGVITTPIALHCCIRWLSGGSHHDIRLTAGMSKASFYKYAHRCIAAINACDALSYNFPTTPLEVEHTATSFHSISKDGLMEGCVAALDGLLLKINVPRKSEVGNVRAFFSGHYQHYGVNVQVS